jgi:hypothetical protein
MIVKKSIFQQIYDQEINFEISCLWDGGFDIALGGSYMEGYKYKSGVKKWDEVENELRRMMREYYPEIKIR